MRHRELRECDFPSPEILLTTEEHDVRVAVPKEHGGSAPHGRRFYWRVRSCDDVECTEWTTPRYLHLGRALDDFNGDGYPDLPLTFQRVARYPTADDRRVQVWWGGPEGISRERVQLLSHDGADVFPIYSVPLGDFDCDGYDDLLVIAAEARSDGTTGAYLGGLLYRGSEAGLVEAGPFPDPGTDPTFADFPPAGVGDVDGDGCDDVVHPDGRLVMFGAVTAVADILSVEGLPARAPIELRGPRPTDLDADGFLDLLWMSPPTLELAILSGAGRQDGVRRLPIVREGRPGEPNPFAERQFTFSANHDADGDGHGDLVVLSIDKMYVLRGQRQLPDIFDVRSPIAHPLPDLFGPYSGDPDGDGRPNLATRNWIRLIDGTRLAQVNVLRAPTVPEPAIQTVCDARDYVPGSFTTVSEMRDYDGDGFDDQLWLAVRSAHYYLLRFSGSDAGLSWGPTELIATFPRDEVWFPAFPVWAPL